MKKHFLFLFMFIMCAVANAQDRKVTGEITSADGEPLIGAAIMLLGSNQGEIADLNGHFSITVKGANPILKISYLGFITKEIAIKKQSHINLPRAPISITASTTNNEGCLLEWKGGRFAKTFSVYRGEELIAQNLINSSFIDYQASVTDPKEYRVFSVNSNGASTTPAKAVGKKAYYFMDSYEDLADGAIIEPWTFRTDRMAYYTEGNPTITSLMPFEGTKSVLINSGKIQLLCDWGGTTKKGYYKIELMVKKAGGGFWMIHSVNDVGGTEPLDNTAEWTHYEFTTGLLDAGVKFNLKVEPYGEGATYIDNFGIEYISPEALDK